MIWFILLPVLVGLAAGIHLWLTTGNPIIFYGAGLLLAGLLVVGLGIGHRQEEPDYVEPQTTHLKASVELINGNTVALHYENGRVVHVWQNAQNGRLWVQEIRNGKPVGRPVTHADNAWRFGKSRGESLAEYVQDAVDKGLTIG